MLKKKSATHPNIMIVNVDQDKRASTSAIFNKEQSNPFDVNLLDNKGKIFCYYYII